MLLSEREHSIFTMLFTKKFDLRFFCDELRKMQPEIEEINKAAYEYIDSCIGNIEGMPNEMLRDNEIMIQGYESSHMLEAVKELLKYGLDPNKIYSEKDKRGYYEEFNIMRELSYVDNGYVAADTLALLLDHGGNPNLILNGESLLRNINFDISFDRLNLKNRFWYDAKVHYWMVLIGYGAKLENGKESIEPCGNFDISNLKNHRQYYYKVINYESIKDGAELCFFDKKTNMEVVRY